jgi:hypothetical protein
MIARKEIGVEEIDGSNTGPRVNEYKSATNLPATEAWPWCAAFVCWVVRQAMRAAGKEFSFKRPTTAGAWDLENWSRRQDASTNTMRNPGDDILPGDIVIFKFSHVGFALSSPMDGEFRTVEGNTDDQGSREGGCVAEKARRTSQVKTRIRFAV